MKKLTRLQKLAIVMGILLIVTYAVAPVVGAKSPGQELGKIIKKVIAHGDITKAHKVMEKAFQKFKEHPVDSGLKVIGAVITTKEGISFALEVVDESGIFKTYDVRHEYNDDAGCLDIYVNDELAGAIAYKKLANLNEDEVNTKINDATDNAITEYQRRH